MAYYELWVKHGNTIVIMAFVVFAAVVLRYVAHRMKSGTPARNGAPSDPVRAKPRESAGEAECRRVLEEMFKRPFPNTRPDFLYNAVTSSGRRRNNLELDCFNRELGIAVEYNGRQHYVYTPHFHRNKETFYNQKYRDEMKRMMCEKNGIHLIEVPYTVRVPDIKQYIVGILSRRNISHQ